jgi:hypothetical protein
MKTFLRTVIIVFVFVVLAYLPVVPISTAPVLPNATYSQKIVSLQRIIWFENAQLDGISYQYHWDTYAVILVLLVVGCLVGALVFRITRSLSNN